MRTYSGFIKELPSNGVFTFGSNTQGIHRAGAALVALQNFDAEYGNPYGPQNFRTLGMNFRSWAICTKDLNKSEHPSISEDFISGQIKQFYSLADSVFHHKDFYIIYSSLGMPLSGYTPPQIARMYSCDNIPKNIIFEEGFAKLITSQLIIGKF